MSAPLKMANNMELISDFIGSRKGHFVGDMVHVSITDLADAITRADIVSEREKKLKEAVRDLARGLQDRLDLDRINLGNPNLYSSLLDKHAETIKECE